MPKNYNGQECIYLGNKKISWESVVCAFITHQCSRGFFEIRLNEQGYDGWTTVTFQILLLEVLRFYMFVMATLPQTLSLQVST